MATGGIADFSDASVKTDWSAGTVTVSKSLLNNNPAGAKIDALVWDMIQHPENYPIETGGSMYEKTARKAYKKLCKAEQLLLDAGFDDYASGVGIFAVALHAELNDLYGA